MQFIHHSAAMETSDRLSESIQVIHFILECITSTVYASHNVVDNYEIRLLRYIINIGEQKLVFSHDVFGTFSKLFYLPYL